MFLIPILHGINKPKFLISISTPCENLAFAVTVAGIAGLTGLTGFTGLTDAVAADVY